jgi:hypothetical protein
MGMNIDTGLAIVILAVLVFYLRLIIVQRERVKRLSHAPVIAGKKKVKGKDQPQVPLPGFSIVSQNRRDWAIAGFGVLAILVGILLNASVISVVAAQPYWWIPTSIGIVAFSWAFKL